MISDVRGRHLLQRDYFYGTAFSLIALAMTSRAVYGGWYLFLLWPALSFGSVGIAYWMGDARIFGKRADGTRHWLATIVLMPYLAFAYLAWSAQVALSRESAFNPVNESLVVSRRLRARELPPGVVQVCDLTCEFIDPELFRSQCDYHCYPILDAGSVSPSELAAMARAIAPPKNGQLLVHCANGHGRTGMFTAIWLVVHGFATTADDAFQLLQAARPGMRLRARQRRVVQAAVSAIQASAEQCNGVEP